LAALYAACLSGCVSTLNAAGNDKGGVIMHGGLRPELAFQTAEKHCKQFGKSAKITDVKFTDYSGDPVLFECI
jgi:hypothetical protein